MSVITSSPDAALDSAYQGIEAAAQDQAPLEGAIDFNEIRLGFALLKKSLGMDLSFGNKIDLALGEFRHGVSADQLGLIWQQRPDVTQAVAAVQKHDNVLSARPEWTRIKNIYEAVRRLGVTLERQLGSYGKKILADPRTQRALRMTADLATRRIAADAWALSRALGAAGSTLGQVRRAVQRLENAAKAGASRADEVSRQPDRSRRAQAAALRSSTGSTPTPHRTPAKARAGAAAARRAQAKRHVAAP